MCATNRLARSSLHTIYNTASAFAASADVEYQFCVLGLVDHVVIDVIGIKLIRGSHVTIISSSVRAMPFGTTSGLSWI
jgi:hypothetical protein